MKNNNFGEPFASALVYSLNLDEKLCCCFFLFVFELVRFLL